MAIPPVNTLSEGFQLPELIVESVIRDGIQNVVNDTTIIPDIFKQLLRFYNQQKYGQTEITKIQTLMNTKPIPVVYSYFDIDAKSPCFSIMVGSDDEAKPLAKTNDYLGDDQEPITDQALLDQLVVASNVQPTAYDPISGKLSLLDSVDLTPVYKGFIYVDAQDNEFFVTQINDVPGQQAIFVDQNSEVDITAVGLIKSPLSYSDTEVRGVTGDVKLVVGVHSKDALTTKYLYILLKYFLLSRKTDLISRGLYLATYNGSDFHRNQEFTGDRVFTRFLTLSGKVDDSWKQDQVELIDAVVIDGIPVE